jgi:hypothetical protein
MPSRLPKNTIETAPATASRIPTIDDCNAIWARIVLIAKEQGPKLFLGRTLLKKEHGDRPGGMGTSSIEEDLWTTAFRSAGITCEFECTQADCGIQCDMNKWPVSIKCTASAMAVNWGKNKTKIKFVFTAPILINYHKPEKPRGDRKELKSGSYFVDPAWCNENVELTSNNKSDYVITDKTATAMLMRAKTTGMYHEIVGLPDNGTHFVMRDPHTRSVYVARMPSAEVLAMMLDS